MESFRTKKRECIVCRPVKYPDTLGSSYKSAAPPFPSMPASTFRVSGKRERHTRSLFKRFVGGRLFSGRDMYEGGEHTKREGKLRLRCSFNGLGMGWPCYFQALVARCSCRVPRVNHLSSIPRPSARRDKVSRKDPKSRERCVSSP